MDAERAYRADAFSPQVITRRLEELVRTAAEFLQTQCRHESLSLLRDHHRTTFALNFWAMVLFARLAMPIMPDTGQRILDLLGLENQTAIDGTDGFVKHGLKLNPDIAPRFEPVSMDIRKAVASVD